MKVDKRSEFKQLVRLAVPLIATQLAVMGIELVDVLMMGRLGKDALAAGGLSFAALGIIVVIGIGMVMANGPCVAQALGAKQPHEAKCYTQHAIYLALILGFLMVFIGYFVPNFLIWFKEPKLIVEKSQLFLHAVIWGLPAVFIFIVLREFVAALMHPKIIMLISLAAIPCNALLNYILMDGKLGLPALGLTGIGIATVVVEYFMLVAIILYTLFKTDIRAYQIWSFEKFDKHRLLSLWRIGWPMGIFFGFEVGMFSVTALLMGHFGENNLAAHQIVLQTAAFVFMIPLGISQATAIRVGYGAGAKNKYQIKLAASFGLLLGLIFAGIAASIFFSFPHFIVSLFLDTKLSTNLPVMKHAISFLLIAAMFQFTDSIQVISNGVLRGLKDTFIPMCSGLGSYWICGLSSGYLLAFVFHYQGLGLWWGLLIGISVSAVLLCLRIIQVYRRFSW